MTRIAICDDESIMLDKISLYIYTYTTNKQIDNCEIFRFGSAAALIQAMDSGIPFDIFILDIYIGEEIGTSHAMSGYGSADWNTKSTYTNSVTLSNTIYGASTTVQPPAATVVPVIKYI